MKCTMRFCNRRMNVALNGDLLKKLECFKYLWSKIIVDGVIKTEVKVMISVLGKVLGGMKKVFMFSCRAMGIKIENVVCKSSCANCTI